MTDVISVALLLAATVSGVVAIATWRRRPAPASLGMTLFMAADALWALSYGLGITSHSATSISVWYVAMYVGLTLTPPFGLLMAYQFRQKTNAVPRWFWGLLLMPVATIAMVATDPWHGYFTSGVGPAFRGEFGTGTWYWLNVAYSYAVAMATLGLLVLEALSLRKRARSQAVLIAAAAAVPFVASVISVAWLVRSYAVDITPIAFTITGAIIAYALLEAGLLRFVPIARDLLVENAEEGMLILDSAGTLLDFNPAASRLIGVTRRDLGAGLGALLGDELAHAAATAEAPLRFETVSPRDASAQFEITVAGIRSGRDKQRLGSYVIVSDVTASKAAMESEREQRLFAEALAGATSAVATSLDLDETLDRILESATQLVRHDAVALYLYDPSSRECWLARSAARGAATERSAGDRCAIEDLPELQRLVETGRPLLISDASAKGDESRVAAQPDPMRATLAAPLKIAGEVAGMLMAESATPFAYRQVDADRLLALATAAALAIGNSRLHDQIKRQSLTDDLTKVSNRRGVTERAAHEMKRSMRSGAVFSLMLLDVDRLKHANDTFGHEFGDRVLQAVAAAVVGEARAVDAVGRTGGDEFAVIMPDTSAVNAQAAAERLRAAVAALELVAPDGTPFPTSVSIGIAEHRPGAEAFEEVVSRADAAMYRSKAAGRDQVTVG